MLNIELIENLYASLPKEQQQNLTSQLFKRSKQNMNYFRRTKDISMSKLETIADFFHMPLDYFRQNGAVKAINVLGDDNQVGNVYINSNLIKEIEGLKKELDSKKETLESKEETIKAKNDTIESQKILIASLQAQLGIPQQ